MPCTHKHWRKACLGVRMQNMMRLPAAVAVNCMHCLRQSACLVHCNDILQGEGRRELLVLIIIEFYHLNHHKIMPASNAQEHVWVGAGLFLLVQRALPPVRLITQCDKTRLSLITRSPPTPNQPPGSGFGLDRGQASSLTRIVPQPVHLRPFCIAVLTQHLKQPQPMPVLNCSSCRVQTRLAFQVCSITCLC